MNDVASPPELFEPLDRLGAALIAEGWARPCRTGRGSDGRTPRPGAGQAWPPLARSLSAVELYPTLANWLRWARAGTGRPDKDHPRRADGGQQVVYSQHPLPVRVRDPGEQGRGQMSTIRGEAPVQLQQSLAKGLGTIGPHSRELGRTIK